MSRYVDESRPPDRLRRNDAHDAHLLTNFEAPPQTSSMLLLLPTVLTAAAAMLSHPGGEQVRAHEAASSRNGGVRDSGSFFSPQDYGDAAHGRSLSTVCGDTCNWASDGMCDDGGAGSELSLCDVGTDCSDCGPRSAASISPPPPSVPATCAWVDDVADVVGTLYFQSDNLYCSYDHTYGGDCGAFAKESDCWKVVTGNRLSPAHGKGMCCSSTGDGACCEADGGSISGVVIGSLVVIFASIWACAKFCKCCSCCPINKHNPKKTRGGSSPAHI